MLGAALCRRPRGEREREEPSPLAATTRRGEAAPWLAPWCLPQVSYSRLLVERAGTFLLEKARVTAQLPGERNFHILHQVAAAAAAAPDAVAGAGGAPMPALGPLSLPPDAALLLGCDDSAQLAQDTEGWDATVSGLALPLPACTPTPAPTSTSTSTPTSRLTTSTPTSTLTPIIRSHLHLHAQPHAHFHPHLHPHPHPPALPPSSPPTMRSRCAPCSP